MVEVFILIAYSLSFQPDSTRPVEAFSLPPMIQSHGHKIAKCRRGGRRTRAGDDDFSVPDTQGYYSDWIVHWKSGSPNGCILFQGWRCMVRFIHIFFHYNTQPCYIFIHFSGLYCIVYTSSMIVFCLCTLSELTDRRIAVHYLHFMDASTDFIWSFALCGEPSKIVLTSGPT